MWSFLDRDICRPMPSGVEAHLCNEWSGRVCAYSAKNTPSLHLMLQFKRVPKHIYGIPLRIAEVSVRSSYLPARSLLNLKL